MDYICNNTDINHCREPISNRRLSNHHLLYHSMPIFDKLHRWSYKQQWHVN